jgi:hypothetical protein
MAQPSSVTTAIRLMWMGAVLSLVPVLLIPSQKDTIRAEIEKDNTADIDALVNFAIGFAVFLGLVGTGLWVWMAIMNGKGKNWARITATVFGGLYLALGAIGLVSGAALGSERTVNLVVTAVTLLLAIVTIVLLWRESSSQWYAPRG